MPDHLRAVEPPAPPRPPSHLRAAGRRLWESVLDLHDLDAPELATLQSAAEALDRAATARRTLDREGLTYTSRFGEPRSRPEADIETRARTGYLAAMKALGLQGDHAEAAPHGDGRYAHSRGARRARKG